MSTIDLKLKTYQQLQFEITKLNTDIFLKDKEIERLKDLVKQLWNNNKSSNLNEEQKELLNSTIFGSDKE